MKRIIKEIYHVSCNEIKKMSTLPLEEDKIMSGYFGLVAICVTQPLCPNNCPFNCKVSVAILMGFKNLKLSYANLSLRTLE